MKNLRKILTLMVLFSAGSVHAQFSELATGGNRYQGVTIDTSQFSHSQTEDVKKEEEETPAPKATRPERVIYSETGIASNYWQPQSTGCPPYRRFDPTAMTAAHKTLKCGSKVKITNLSNGKSVIVTINDRGPYVRGRIIDMSRSSYQKISSNGGITKVKIEVLSSK